MDDSDLKYASMNECTSNPDSKYDGNFELMEEEIVESEDYAIYDQQDLPLNGFQIMEDIRRRGKLCDVTLKVDFLFSMVF